MHKKRTALVTGAAQGIGSAIVERLTDEGWYVVAIDKNKKEGEAFQKKLGKRKVEFLPADVSSEKEVALLYNYLEKRKIPVTALINNAGIIKDNMIWNMPAEDFDSVISVNLKGTWLMCKGAAAVMKTQGYGRIVNIASRAWLGNRGQSNYAASKAGVVSLTRVLALELGKYNVLVNAIAPGLIDSPLSQNLEAGVLQKLIEAQPTKNMGRPEDVANAVSFLVSERTHFITGQTIYVDGGKSIGAGI